MNQKSIYIALFLLLSVQFISAKNVLPCEINEAMTLTKDQSPYYVECDVKVKKGVTLTIEPGSAIEFVDTGNIIIYGRMSAVGTEKDIIKFNVESPVLVNKVRVIGGEVNFNYVDFSKLVFAANNSIINISNSVFSYMNDPLPGIGQVLIGYTESKVVIENSTFNANDMEGMMINHCDSAIITKNTFNYLPDAAEFSFCTNCLIANNTISYSADDAIDMNGCDSIKVLNNRIFYPKDKGVSIGRYIEGRSTNILVEGNLIVGADIGIAVKDSSEAIILNNTLYDNNYSISVYNDYDDAGKNKLELANNIIYKSNSADINEEYSSDLTFRFNLTENVLLYGKGNITGDPMFFDPASNNFHLKKGSPAIDAGDPESGKDPDSSRKDIGAYYFDRDVPVNDGKAELNAQIIYNYGFNQLIIENAGGESIYKVQMFSLDGKLIRRIDDIYPGKGVIKLDLPKEINSGVYLIEITNKFRSQLIKYLKY